LGGAVVINVYKRADGKQNMEMSDEDVKKASQFDYNPAVEARYVTKEDGEKVRSKVVRNEYALGDTLEKIQSRL
jgi:sterol carrier protein 2